MILLADSLYSTVDGKPVRSGKKIYVFNKQAAAAVATDDSKLAQRAFMQARKELQYHLITKRRDLRLTADNVLGVMRKGFLRTLDREGRRVRTSFLVGLISPPHGTPIIARFDNPDFDPVVIEDRMYAGSSPAAADAFYTALRSQPIEQLRDLGDVRGWAMWALMALTEALRGGHVSVDGPVQHVALTCQGLFEGQAWDINPAENVEMRKVGERPSALEGPG